MSIYNANIKSWVISPVFHRSNLRTEFRLPENATFTSNLRLINVGVLTTAGNTTVRYNYLAGSAGCIRNIYLMDGKTVLDQVLNFQSLEGFKRYNKTNEVNCDMAKVLKNHGMGFCYDRGAVSGGVVPNALIKEFNPVSPNIPNAVESTTPSAFINLQEVFPLLNAMLFLDTTLFSRLSVIVEYTLLNAIVYDQNIKATATLQPLLVADEILETSKVPKFTGVSWNTMELESVQVPQGQDDSTQVINRKLMGFNEKTLNRVLVQKALLDNGSPFYGTLGSEAMVEEVFQVVVNGSNLLADQGINSSAMAMSMLSDVFGNCNSIPCCGDVGVYNFANFFEDATKRIGHLSYYGVQVAEKIKNLQITYSRKCRKNGSATYKAQMILNIFGEVTKSIVLTKDGYKVMYL
jgi:hypothetical protein